MFSWSWLELVWQYEKSTSIIIRIRPIHQFISASILFLWFYRFCILIFLLKEVPFWFRFFGAYVILKFRESRPVSEAWEEGRSTASSTYYYQAPVQLFWRWSHYLKALKCEMVSLGPRIQERPIFIFEKVTSASWMSIWKGGGHWGTWTPAHGHSIPATFGLAAN